MQQGCELPAMLVLGWPDKWQGGKGSLSREQKQVLLALLETGFADDKDLSVQMEALVSVRDYNKDHTTPCPSSSAFSSSKTQAPCPPECTHRSARTGPAGC